MAKFECVITGCNLLDEAGMRWTRGDLFYSSNTYVLHAVLNGMDTGWIYDQPIPEDRPYIMIAREYDFFERRGVIVFQDYQASLSKAAREYLKL